MITSGAPVISALDRLAIKTVTFTGAANLGQAGTTVPVFTVTGEVLVVFMVPFCTTNLGEAVGGATVSLGTTSAVDLFCALTNSVDIDAGEFWHAAAPADLYGLAVPANLKDIGVFNGEDIIVDCAAQNTNAGVIQFDCYWRPLSSDGSLVAA